MRKRTLELLRCVRCREGSLVPEQPVPEPRLVFGPVACTHCGARYPVGEGLIDLVGDRRQPQGLQRALESQAVARSWEAWGRPLLSVVLGRRRVDVESELLLYRSLLGEPKGPVLDLGCGTGLFSRKLAGPPHPAHVIGLDVSRPMIEEAMALAREHGAPVDFVRAEAPELPFHTGCLDAVLVADTVALVEALAPLVLEVARVLRPGGRFVASTLLPWPVGRLVQIPWGLFPRGEASLREVVEHAGLVRFERARVPPFLVVKAEKPGPDLR